MADARRTRNRPALPTILVVSPAAETQRFVGETLTAAGFRVTEADDGRAGLERARSSRHDLALLDASALGIDAQATLREVRADPDLSSLPVLLLLTNDDDRPNFALAASPYVRLPCQPHELVARVGIALGAKDDNALAYRAASAEDDSIDVLTGLADRGCMETRILEMAARYGPQAVVTVFMVGPDEFDSIIDAHGVAVGDIVLRITAGRLQGAVVNESILICRWDRCMFLAAGVGIDAAQAHFLGERLRHVVAMHPYAVGDDRSLPVTVSVGAASGFLATCGAVLRAADDGWLAATRAGGGRVVFASLTASP
jgi:diguanylate cyclase (GGDEF)-like protein